MEAELAKKIVDSLREAGVNFVTYPPETRLSQTFELLPVANGLKGLPLRLELF